MLLSFGLIMHAQPYTAVINFKKANQVNKLFDFESSYTNASSTFDAYAEARNHNSSDTIATKAAALVAINYLLSHWTLQEINDNVNALWPMPYVFGYACNQHCYLDCVNCLKGAGPQHGGEMSDFVYLCMIQYDMCKANCH